MGKIIDCIQEIYPYIHSSEKIQFHDDWDSHLFKCKGTILFDYNEYDLEVVMHDTLYDELVEKGYLYDVIKEATLLLFRDYLKLKVECFDTYFIMKNYYL